MTSARVRDTRVENVGNKRSAIPVIGKVRAGIQIVKSAAKAIPGVMQSYVDGVMAGASFDDIAKRLLTIKGCPSNPLVPKNTSFFRVIPDDFITPGSAEAIMDAYGTMRPGDKAPKLYTFPVIFRSNNIDDIFRE